LKKILFITIFLSLFTLSLKSEATAWCEPDDNSGASCSSGYTYDCNCSVRKIEACCATYITTSCVYNNCTQYAPWSCSSSYSSFCYNTSTSCGGTCGSCTPPACSTLSGSYYTVTSDNGCSSTSTSCTRYDDCGSCGTDTRTCWLQKYTVNFSAGTGGYISGTTSQSICRGGSGTQVTAVANTGYIFTQWSDSSTSASRTPTNVTSSYTLTASFILDNQAPSSPTNLKVEGVSNPIGVTNTYPGFTATYVDPDTSDTAIYYQIQVNTNSTFTGTVMWDSTKTSLSPAVSQGNTIPSKAYIPSNLSLNGTTYYWRIKFWDNSNVEGAWSTGTNTFTMNTPPSAPTELQTEQATNPTRVSDQLPDFRAKFQDPNTSDTGTKYEIQVNTTNDFSGSILWQSGQQTMASTARTTYSPEIQYGGSALALNGATYYWRIRFTDNYGTVGAWSATAQFTMNQPPTAPTLLQTEGATNPSGVDDTTPEFSAIFNDPDTGDTGTQYEIDVNTSSAFNGTVMWSSGQQSMTSTAIGVRSPTISYAGTPLTQNGATYYWRIRFTDNNGTVGAWSATANFTMNNPPNAPSALYTEGTTNPTNVGDLTPEFSAVFTDPESSDTGIYYELEVNTNSSFTGTVMWDSGKMSISAINHNARSSDISYSGTAFTHNNTTYYWRIRFWDQKDAVSSWSATANFKMQNQPDAPSGLQTDSVTNNTNVSDTTPEFSAVFTDSDAGDTGTYYEIEVNTNDTFTGTVMWDSNKVSHSPAITNGSRSSEISYTPVNLTTNGTIYYWRIRFWDQNDAVSNWSAVANFRMQRQPSPPTDLLTDGSSNPNAVASLYPQFSAIHNDVNGNAATAYEIEINTQSNFLGTVKWDTGKLSTSVSSGARSPNYTYAGTALADDSSTYYWRIRFWDTDDLQGDWSATASFVTNLNHQLFNGLRMNGLRLN
jgi:hypothetical protein